MTDLSGLTLAQRHLITTSTARLKDEFAGVFATETIERFIADSLDQLLPNATVTTFVPIFVERFTRDRLKALAKVEGKTSAIFPRCCSCASTTPAAPRWPPAGCAASPATGSASPRSCPSVSARLS